MNKIYYRTRQALLSAVLKVAPSKEPKLITGAGTMMKLPKLVKENGIKRVEIITTAGFMKRGTLKPLFELLKSENISYAIYSEVKPDPTIECIEEAVSLYKKEGCEGIIAIGGGSVMDCAKVVGARIACPNKTVSDMTGLMRIMKKLPVLFAVPTTAGTGSEVTAGAVITDGKTHYKHTIMDLSIVPAYAILDPELTCTLPKDITAVTGMDALTHAVEAYINRFAPKNASENALKAVKLIHENLIPAYEDGQNIKARENLLIGSYYAGIAITNAYVGYVHAIAHGIGGLYGVPHGKANAVILPRVLEGYGEAAYEKLADLADIIGLKGNTKEEKAKAFIKEIEEMNSKMGLPEKLEVVKEKDIPELIKRAIYEANPLYPVPTIWGEEEFYKVIREI
ncbi:iron-containing alcohol dehydrogenase [Clostridium sp. YIM B02505]|uniref:Iron-containing alcohol dehydrogenase n=1 Tax=Clostridium yunnanense TaxID=2800325 RepID=A0ABS1ERY5_9CLOT|nr:iron-containing alcohol dehydrogenase [Clostridium yunnanense]MBK1812161.1 iron-containing alcohol dehydrogenase [Clostridium yunnanense]